jgi:NADPH:quinone reductase-like Zn-dependent oxidoreductase
MRAVVLHEYGGPEKLKFEDNVPEPQISGSTVLIAAAAASVNPIDWKLRAGMRQKDSPLSFPAILGRDVSGIVRAVGANVKHFKAGDRVLALSNATYAELVAVNDSDVAHLPDGVDLANAAAIPLISLTGDQLVRLAANVQKGQVVLITGALGSVGRAAVHTAKKVGAQVIAGVRGKEMDDARSLGVSDVLAIDDDQAIELPLSGCNCGHRWRGRCSEADREGKAERLLWVRRNLAGKRGRPKSDSEDYARACAA